MRTTRLTFIAGACTLALSTIAPASAQKSLCIRVPSGIDHGFVGIESSTEAGMQYVVIPQVVIKNGAQTQGSYRLNDFSLIVGEKRYHPTARPGLGAIDISRGGIIGPKEAIRGNLAFLVPQNVNAGSVEFKPSNWLNDRGVPIAYCCASSCG